MAINDAVLSPTLILLGIGNIGSEYAETRHNIGFDVVDALLKATPQESQKEVSLHHSTATLVDIQGVTVLCIKPTTYVNLSGVAAKEALDLFDLDAEHLLVIVDDFHLPLSRIRYRGKGSAGGHNGLKSIIAETGELFHRLRVGIGPLPEELSIIDFVLGHFSSDESEQRAVAIERSVESIYWYVAEGLGDTMNRFNASNG